MVICPPQLLVSSPGKERGGTNHFRWLKHGIYPSLAFKERYRTRVAGIDQLPSSHTQQRNGKNLDVRPTHIWTGNIGDRPRLTIFIAHQRLGDRFTILLNRPMAGHYLDSRGTGLGLPGPRAAGNGAFPIIIVSVNGYNNLFWKILISGIPRGGLFLTILQAASTPSFFRNSFFFEILCFTFKKIELNEWSKTREF